MALIEWIHVCDHAFLDQAGKLCLIGIFQYVVAYQLPHVMPHANIIYLLKGQPGESVPVHITMQMQPPHGPFVLDQALDSLQLSEAGEAVGILALDGFPLHQDGSYVITLRTPHDSKSVSFVLALLPNS